MLRSEFARRFEGLLPDGWRRAIAAVKAKFAADAPKIATRQASGLVLDALAPVLPELVGGSADLTGSNNTQRQEPEGDYARRISPAATSITACASTPWRAAMNGMAAHGGVHSLWRHVPGVHRLLPAGDPALRR